MYEPKVKEKAEFERIWNEVEESHNWNPTQWKRKLLECNLEISIQTLDKWIKRSKNETFGETFDFRKYLNDNKAALTKSAVDGALQGKARQSEILFKMMGELNDKKVERIEYTNSDISRDAERFIEYLRQSLKDCGICPVCKQS